MNRFSVVLISLSIVLTYLSLTWGVEGKSESGLNISSPAFEMHGLIPAKYTCDGLNVNPPLVIGGVPSGTKSLALIVDDPDAPMGMWVHWVVWNMNPTTREIKENSVANGAVEGVNDFRRNAYGGPCPPSGTHRYFFKLYALDAILEISPKTNKAGLESEMKGHVLTKVEFVGIYKRR
ncbi:MAG: YbhB/YbcL family Raf kinase inhibitor-like protein [Dissulfurispiraceae bacterium]